MNYEPTKNDIALSFAKRQTADSEFSHWDIKLPELIQRVVDNFGKWEQSYREGVVSVPVDPKGFYSGVVTLQPFTVLEAQYRARKEGEEPRKQITALGGVKLPAKSCNVILYHHSVLAENNENETEAEWEIISVNASPTETEMPIPPDALIANQFELSGGTSTGLTDAEFVARLKESVLFWKDKCLVSPKTRN